MDANLLTQIGVILTLLIGIFNYWETHRTGDVTSLKGKADTITTLLANQDKFAATTLKAEQAFDELKKEYEEYKQNATEELEKIKTFVMDLHNYEVLTVVQLGVDPKVLESKVTHLGTVKPSDVIKVIKSAKDI